MEFSRRTGLVAVATAALALGLSACGAAAPEAANTSASSVEAAFPVSIEHIYGTTEITKKPERIATISWVNADAVLALGVVPVGMDADSYGNNAKNSTDWKDAKLTELGAEIGSEKAPVQYSAADGVNFTAIAEVQPDLIVAGYSGLTKDEYDKLSKIAPVIGPLAANYTASWQTVTSAVGKALGKDAEAKSLVTELEGKVAAAAEANPVFKETTFIAGDLNPTTNVISIYATGDNRPRFLSALGMTQAKVVDDNAKDGEFYLEWSAERANELDSDVFFTAVAPGSADTVIIDNKLFAQIPAVTKGGLVTLNNDMDVLAISATSPLSIQWTIDKLVPKLAAGAKAATGK